MSEYQYYEFRAIDRPLTEDEMDELRGLSSRADITATSFTNTYNYGDFRGDPRRLMKEYFDAFVYVANWGTHRFALRLPRRLIDVKQASLYCTSDRASLEVAGEHVVLDFDSQEEGGDWEQGEGWLDALLPVRQDLLAGDLRSLYLGWLMAAQEGELEDDTPEPPVPPGLASLTPTLQKFADFLRIDAELIQAAAERSPAGGATDPSRAELEALIDALPESEKNDLLLRVVEGDAPHMRGEFLQRFRRERKPIAKETRPKVPKRTVREILDAAQRRDEEKQRQQAQREARERQRREREQATARAKHLDALAGREAECWRQVESLIQTKRPKDYDQAMELLKDLRDLGDRQGTAADVSARIGQLRERHSGKSSLMRRFREAGFVT